VLEPSIEDPEYAEKMEKFEEYEALKEK